MAEKTVVIKVDDLDHTSPATSRRRFAIGNRYYEIDLNDTHAAEFDATLAPWIKHARSVQNPAKIEITNLKIRLWAAHNNINLSPNGRIPRKIREAYHHAETDGSPQ